MVRRRRAGDRRTSGPLTSRPMLRCQLYFGRPRSSTTSSTSCWSSSSRSSTRSIVRQHARHRRQPEEDRARSFRASGPGEPTVDYINKILFRITTAAAVYLGLLAVLPSLQRDTRHHHALHRLDLAADRRRRRARLDHADRSAPSDARLPRVHQEVILRVSWARRAPARERKRKILEERFGYRADLDRRYAAPAPRREDAARARSAELHGAREARSRRPDHPHDGSRAGERRERDRSTASRARSRRPKRSTRCSRARA